MKQSQFLVLILSVLLFSHAFANDYQHIPNQDDKTRSQYDQNVNFRGQQQVPPSNNYLQQHYGQYYVSPSQKNYQAQQEVQNNQQGNQYDSVQSIPEPVQQQTYENIVQDNQYIHQEAQIQLENIQQIGEEIHQEQYVPESQEISQAKPEYIQQVYEEVIQVADDQYYIEETFEPEQVYTQEPQAHDVNYQEDTQAYQNQYEQVYNHVEPVEQQNVQDNVEAVETQYVEESVEQKETQQYQSYEEHNTQRAQPESQQTEQQYTEEVLQSSHYEYDQQYTQEYDQKYGQQYEQQYEQQLTQQHTEIQYQEAQQPAEPVNDDIQYDEQYQHENVSAQYIAENTQPESQEVEQPHEQYPQEVVENNYQQTQEPVEQQPQYQEEYQDESAQYEQSGYEQEYAQQQEDQPAENTAQYEQQTPEQVQQNSQPVDNQDQYHQETVQQTDQQETQPVDDVPDVVELYYDYYSQQGDQILDEYAQETVEPVHNEAIEVNSEPIQQVDEQPQIEYRTGFRQPYVESKPAEAQPVQETPVQPAQQVQQEERVQPKQQEVSVKTVPETSNISTEEDSYDVVEKFFVTVAGPAYRQFKENYYLNLAVKGGFGLIWVAILIAVVNKLIFSKPTDQSLLGELKTLKTQLNTLTQGGAPAGSSFFAELKNELKTLNQNIARNESTTAALINDKKKIDSFVVEFQHEVMESHKAIWKELNHIGKSFSSAPSLKIPAKTKKVVKGEAPLSSLLSDETNANTPATSLMFGQQNSATSVINNENVKLNNTVAQASSPISPPEADSASSTLTPKPVKSIGKPVVNISSFGTRGGMPLSQMLSMNGEKSPISGIEAPITNPVNPFKVKPIGAPKSVF